MEGSKQVQAVPRAMVLAGQGFSLSQTCGEQVLLVLWKVSVDPVMSNTASSPALVFADSGEPVCERHPDLRGAPEGAVAGRSPAPHSPNPLTPPPACHQAVSLRGPRSASPLSLLLSTPSLPASCTHLRINHPLTSLLFEFPLFFTFKGLNHLESLLSHSVRSEFMSF